MRTRQFRVPGSRVQVPVQRSLACVVVAVLWITASPAPAGAQSPAPPLHRLELSVAVGVLGGASLGSSDANLRPSTSGEPYKLFGTNSRLTSAPILDLRAGIAVTRRYAFEAHVLFGHPELRTDISADVEGAPAITAVERLDHYLIDGGVNVRLEELRWKGLTPFAAAGAGYLRQLHEGLTVIEEGRVYYVGGGANYWLFSRMRGLLRAAGARADLRLNRLSGGIALDEGLRSHVSVSGSFLVAF
ncbi:MAG TPA: hypothetical protein VI485_23315 [Vicinamibacterales bacterium]|nr:hypothetical protein [Vicinamibacterales bacterium]